MPRLEQLIYLLLTVLIPLKSTYTAIRNSNPQLQKQWSIYWSIYFAFKSLQWNFELFQYRFLDFVFVVLVVWMYNGAYKGAMILGEVLEQGVERMKGLKEKLAFIPIFEQANPEAEPKPKSE